MSRAVRPAALRLLAIGLLAVLANTASVAAADQLRLPWTPPGGGMGGSYVVLALPGSITTAEVEWFEDTLRLSEAQAQVFRSLHQQFAEQDEAIRREHFAPLWDRSRELIATGNNVPHSIAAGEAMESLVRDTVEPFRRLAAAEEQFFTRVAPFLTAEQAARLPRVKEHRARVRYASLRSFFPATALDLSYEMHRLARREPAAVAVGDVDELLARYEAQLTPLFRHRYDAQLARAGTGFRMQAEMLDRHQSMVDAGEPTPDMSSEVAAIEALQREIVRWERRIHELNAQYAPLVLAHVAQPWRQDLKAKLDATLYGPVYPNPWNLSDVLRAIDEIANRSSEDASAVAAHRQHYERELAQIERQMKALFIDFSEDLRSTLTSDSRGEEAYREAMLEQQRRRKDLALSTLKATVAVLDEEQRMQIAPALELYEAAAADYERFMTKREAHPHTAWPRRRWMP